MSINTNLPFHLHASIQSHLCAELSLLQAFIRRAAAQHRTQLFLQRMKGVLRISKAVLAFIKICQEKGVNEEKVSRGKHLVRKLVSMLHSAYYISIQIVALHHFLPLQASVISIYARIYMIILNVAIALNIDIEHLMVSAGSPVRTNKFRYSERGPTTVTIQEPKSMNEDIGDEIGVKIQRPALPIKTLKEPLPPTTYSNPDDTQTKSTMPQSQNSSRNHQTAMAVVNGGEKIVSTEIDRVPFILDIEALPEKGPKSGMTEKITLDTEKIVKEVRTLELPESAVLKNKSRVSEEQPSPTISHCTMEDLVDGKQETALRKKKIRTNEGKDKMKKDHCRVKKRKKDAMDDIFGF
nr:hypothetical protein L204_02736 [Cryptococcus depauperatus CBS 7855]